jgi:hypothetical protein
MEGSGRHAGGKGWRRGGIRMVWTFFQVGSRVEEICTRHQVDILGQ